MTDEARVVVQIRNMNNMAAHALVEDLERVLDRHQLDYSVYRSKVRP